MLESGIVYTTGDETIIDEIDGLWNELNRVHFEKSRFFKQEYAEYTFRDRKQSLLEKEKIFVVIARSNGEKIGYCTASVSGGVGEIDSIYIKPYFRRNGIGGALIKKSLDWILSNQAKKVVVQFIAGNDEVLGFYSKFGFKPSHTELQL